MEIGPRTKINSVIREYPFLKEFLASNNPNFKVLENPILRKTIGRVATLSRAAVMGGTDVNTLIKDIAAEIKRKTGEIVSTVTEKPPGAIDRGERTEILKSIIRDIHKGQNVEILKQRLRLLIHDVGPSELANLEQKLIDEGMPAEEVKRLCSTHVAVVKESLEHKSVPGLPAGHPVHTFMLENREAEAIMAAIEQMQDPQNEGPRFAELIDRLMEIEKHYVRKENQVFPVLETKGISGPSQVMWGRHDDIRGLLKDLRAKIASATFLETDVQAVLENLRDMIYMEEHILFPMALETLDEQEWARAKMGEEEVGYSWIDNVEHWEPASGAYQQAMAPDKIGSLNLDTGLLTVEQVNLLLTHLPLDVSFVNEKDEVVYYSQTSERLFPRSPGVIGRKVQNCHPPKSMAVVEKLLEEFKSGQRDVAEFWIQAGGKFIHIRYFAVRSAEGRYVGTLEVSQDITDIRSLEGQKRLLD